MKIKLRYFASLREALGAGEEAEFGNDAPLTVGQLRAQLVARGGAYAQCLARDRAVRCAVNQDMADDAAPVGDGVEVAFFPPVTGG